MAGMRSSGVLVVRTLSAKLLNRTAEIVRAALCPLLELDKRPNLLNVFTVCETESAIV